jgi:hypothetical protein
MKQSLVLGVVTAGFALWKPPGTAIKSLTPSDLA